MKITTVKFGKTYSLGNFCSERIDLEASIDETQESVTDAIFQLREYCDQIHKKNNPHLYQDQPIHVSGQWEEKQQEPEPKLSPQEQIINQINQCSTIDVLKTFELLVKKNSELQQVYNKKLKTFQQ